MKKLLILLFAVLTLSLSAGKVNTKYINGFPSTAYNITLSSDVSYWSMYGVKTLSAPYVIGVTGTPVNGECIVLAYDGSSITTNNNAVTVFGVALSGTPDPTGLSGWLSAAQGKYIFVAVYKSTVWEVNYFRTSGSTHWIGKSDIGAIGNDTTIQVTSSGGIRIKPLSITSAHISTAAAIPYSKLDLIGSLVNADVDSSAAIDLIKMKALTASKALVSNAGGVIVPSAVTSTELGYVSGVTSPIQTQMGTKITAGGGAIVDADVNASAAIAHSKMAALTASKALVSDGSGVVSPSSVTSTELGYVSGATSNLQTQITALGSGTSAVTYSNLTGATVLTSLKANITVNSSGGGFNITLPLASTITAGNFTEFFLIGVNTAKILTQGSDKILNIYNAVVTSDTLTPTKRGVMVYSDGSANWIIGRKY